MPDDLRFRLMAPPPGLGSDIRFMYEMVAPGGTGPLLNHPQGAVDLILVLEGGVRFDKGPGGFRIRTPWSLVVPVQTEFFRFCFDPGTRIFGIALGPTGWRRYVDVPRAGLVDRAMDPVAMGDPGFRALREEVGGLHSDQWTSAVARWGAPRGGRCPDERRRRLRGGLDALPTRRRMTVPQLASELGMGERTLQRTFRRELGISPKTALRLARFRRVMARMEGATSWSSLAVEEGFFDQAHLCNELRRFTGLPPVELRRRERPLAEAFDRARAEVGFEHEGARRV